MSVVHTAPIEINPGWVANLDGTLTRINGVSFFMHIFCHFFLAAEMATVGHRRVPVARCPGLNVTFAILKLCKMLAIS